MAQGFSGRRGPQSSDRPFFPRTARADRPWPAPEPRRRRLRARFDDAPSQRTSAPVEARSAVGSAKRPKLRATSAQRLSDVESGRGQSHACFGLGALGLEISSQGSCSAFALDCHQSQSLPRLLEGLFRCPEAGERPFEVRIGRHDLQLNHAGRPLVAGAHHLHHGFCLAGPCRPTQPVKQPPSEIQPDVPITVIRSEFIECRRRDERANSGVQAGKPGLPALRPSKLLRIRPPCARSPALEAAEGLRSDLPRIPRERRAPRPRSGPFRMGRSTSTPMSSARLARARRRRFSFRTMRLSVSADRTRRDGRSDLSRAPPSIWTRARSRRAWTVYCAAWPISTNARAARTSK